jgi:hypothetical protein
MKEKRRIPMKTRILAVAAALLAFTMVAAQSKAQTWRMVQVNVPFAFTVGNTTLPAGEYTIQRVLNTSESVELIRSKDGSASMIVSTKIADQDSKDREPRMIFHRYGDQYFLSQIWFSGDSGRELYKSRGEKELASNQAPTELAVLLSVAAGQP